MQSQGKSRSLARMVRVPVDEEGEVVKLESWVRPGRIFCLGKFGKSDCSGTNGSGRKRDLDERPGDRMEMNRRVYGADRVRP